jgi:hypothetical protein
MEANGIGTGGQSEAAAAPRPPSVEAVPSHDETAASLAKAVREIIKEELDKRNRGPIPPPEPATQWGAFWTFVLFTDFVLIASLLVEAVLEGANLKQFLDFVPLLTPLLFWLLPQFRQRLDTMSQNLVFRSISAVFLGPLVWAVVPLTRIPVDIQPAGTPVTINGKEQSYPDGYLAVGLRLSYEIKATPTDPVNPESHSCRVTLTEALHHWRSQEKVSCVLLWYDIAYESFQTPDIHVRVLRKGGSPKDFMNVAQTYRYSASDRSPGEFGTTALSTSFSEDGSTGNRRKPSTLPHGHYHFTAWKAGFKPADLDLDVTSPNTTVPFPLLIEEPKGRP